jgi:hypothetical protein
MPTKYTFIIIFLLVVISSLVACKTQTTLPPDSNQAQAADTTQRARGTTAFTSVRRTAAIQSSSLILDPSKGQETGLIYQAFLSPHQEPGEEKDMPALIPGEFRSTAPSLLRSERSSRGHGVLRFTNDLSKVYVEVQVENVNPEEVVMFHIHCGRPDMLGPILIDFAVSGDIQENLADGIFSVLLTNADIEKTVQAGHGIVGAFTVGCPVVPGLTDKVKTIAGMEYIAQQGELYFNLHTKGQTFFGDIRGQLHPVAESINGNETTP